MAVVDRIMAVVAATLLVVLAVIVAAAMLGWNAEAMISAMQLLRGRYLEGLAVVILLGIGAVYFVLVAVRRSAPRSVRWEGELGDVEVSLTTVEALARAAAQEVEGIVDVVPTAYRDTDGLRIGLRMTVPPDQSIPDLSSKVQSLVASHVENIIGVPVVATSIQVRGIGSVREKSRVQ
ncbi:MAG: alkaline shock response membrane anchor protein AmaP [Firmicutes bacterium]|nr:alkaline shock response membrane anchor protein AmaP [Bacillota bacterium]